MRKNKRNLFAAAAVIFALLASGCENDAAVEWDGGLPAAATEQPGPTVSYMTEESAESTSPITFAESETTKRTAYSETGPELATTTSGASSETTEDGEISTVSGVPNVPISEFTSTTPLDLAELGKTDTSASSSSESSYQSTQSSDTSASSSSGSASSLSDGTTSVPAEIEGVLNEDSGSKNTGAGIERPYSYKFLNDKQTYIYDAIITAAENHRETINLSSVMDITAEDYCEAYQLIYDDEQALFYIDTKMQYAVNSNTRKLANATVFYKYSKSETERMQAEIDAEVNKILAEVTPDMTDYDKVKLFNDVLASTVAYDESAPNCRDIYGVFVGKKAICGGYSKAFSYLCGKVGIETATVTGDADGQPHMWNKVKIDGKWYNVDVTYAVANSQGEPYVRYDYFCVTDEMLSSSRVVYEQSYKYPEAVDEDCGYFEKNGLVAESWQEAKRILTEELITASETGSTPVQVKCADREVYEETVYYLFDSKQKKALEILEDAYSEAYVKYDRSVVNYSQDATSKVIKLFPAYNE